MPPLGPSALGEGCLGISEQGGAVEGDRTMLDASIPAAQAFAGPTYAGLTRDVLLQKMVHAAKNGRDKSDDAAAWTLKLHGRSRGWACRSRCCGRRDLAICFAEGVEPGSAALNLARGQVRRSRQMTINSLLFHHNTLLP